MHSMVGVAWADMGLHDSWVADFVECDVHHECESDIDVEVLDEGRLLLAYRSEDKDPAARKGGIYVSAFGSGQWGRPSPVGHGAGLAHGDPRLVSHGGRVLMVWRHQAEVRKGGMVATGPTASFSVRNRAGAWSASRLVREIPTDPLAGLDRGPTFYTLYCDASGKVHMTWGGKSVLYVNLEDLAVDPTRQ